MENYASNTRLYMFNKILTYNLLGFCILFLFKHLLDFAELKHNSFTEAMIFAMVIVPLSLAIILSSVIVFGLQQNVTKNYQQDSITSKLHFNKSTLFSNFLSYMFSFFVCILAPTFLFDAKFAGASSIILCIIPIIIISLLWLAVFVFETKQITKNLSLQLLYKSWVWLVILITSLAITMFYIWRNIIVFLPK